MEQKYIKDGQFLHGKVNFEKKCIANYIDLIRISPTTARVFLLLCSYMSRNNKVITDSNSISKILAIAESKTVEASLRSLIENGYITMDTIKLNSKKEITGVIHDRNLYNESKAEKWEVIGNKVITNYILDGEFNIFTVSEDFATGDECTEEGSNLILHIKDRLFFDTTISEEDIQTFIYPEQYQ